MLDSLPIKSRDEALAAGRMFWGDHADELADAACLHGGPAAAERVFSSGIRLEMATRIDAQIRRDLVSLHRLLALTDVGPAVVDRGYRGHAVEATRVLISGTCRGLMPVLAKLLRRRSAIEPEIGQVKTDGRLARCPLKGAEGDANLAELCACGHNVRKILANFKALLALIIAAFLASLERDNSARSGVVKE